MRSTVHDLTLHLKTISLCDLVDAQGGETMQCKTIKPGVECDFWKRQCTYPGGSCYEAVEQCLTGGKKGEACERVGEFGGKKYCLAFAEPKAK